MSPADAARLLDVTPDATPEQVEARFGELRSKLEDRIARAPTPGLKEKYRATLAEITTAFETLTLAADGSALPVLQRQRPTPAPAAPSSTEPSAAPTVPPPGGTGRTSRSAGNREFLVVALIALLLLGGGAWWVLKSRADAAEQARIATAAKAEAERDATEQARREAEAKEAADQEKVRQEGLAAGLRAHLAESRVRWEALERELQAAERRVSDLSSRERSLRDAPAPERAEAAALLQAQQDYAGWLQAHLLRHPAKTLMARLDALLASRAIDEAVGTGTELTTALEQADANVASEQRTRLMITGTVRVQSDPAGLAWTLTDAFGRTHEGTTPAELPEVAMGAASVTVRRDGWPDVVRTIAVSRGATAEASAAFPAGALRITSDPEDLEWTLTDAFGSTRTGRTPADLADVPVGRTSVRITHPGWPPATRSIDVLASGSQLHEVFAGGDLRVESSPTGASALVNGKPAGVTPLHLEDLPPGPYELELTFPNYAPETLKTVIEAGEAVVLQAPLRRNPDPLPRPGYFWEVPRLGLAFVPVPGTRVLAGATKLHAGAYAVFAEDTRREATVYRQLTLRISWNDLDQVEGAFTYGLTSSSPERPVTVVTWQDAAAFCEWLTKRERTAGRLAQGQRYRLPTSEEWDVFVRPAFGHPLDDNRTPVLWPIGFGPANPFGLHDLYTWVREWMADETSSGTRSYRGVAGALMARPSGGDETSNSTRIYRGGAKAGRVAGVAIEPTQSVAEMSSRTTYLQGFRCVLDLGTVNPAPGATGLEFDEELQIQRVSSGSAEERAGLLVGDRVAAIDGRTLAAGDRWAPWRLRGPAGSEAHLEVRRGAEIHHVTVTRSTR